MKHQIKRDLIDICGLILKENKTTREWGEIESDDMFQKGDYEGGFDATGNEFCFSVYIDEEEYWFQISLERVKLVYDGVISEIEIKKAE